MKMEKEAWTLLENEVRSLIVTDCYATPTCGALTPEGPWGWLQGQEKRRLAHLLGLSLQSCSDFEAFARWERAWRLSPAVGGSRWYEAERQWMGLSADSSEEAWRQGLGFLSTVPLSYKEILEERGVRPLSCRWDLNRRLQEPAEMTLAEWAEKTARLVEGEREPHLFLTLPKCYGRPDPYHGEQAYRKRRLGKPLKESEETILLLQGLILLLQSLSEECRPVIHWQGNLAEQGIQEGLAYLRSRGLLRGEVRLRVGLSLGTQWTMDPLMGKEARPELTLLESDFTDSLSEKLVALAEQYPLGGICFGGIDTDSATFFLGHKILRGALCDALGQLCATETQAIAVATAFLKGEL